MNQLGLRKQIIQPRGKILAPINSPTLPIDGPLVWSIQQKVVDNGDDYAVTDSDFGSGCDNYTQSAPGGYFRDYDFQQYQLKMYYIRLWSDTIRRIPLAFDWKYNIYITMEDANGVYIIHNTGTDRNIIAQTTVPISIAGWTDLKICIYAGVSNQSFSMLLEPSVINQFMTPVIGGTGRGIPRGEPFLWIFKMVDETDFWTPEPDLSPLPSVQVYGSGTAGFTGVTGSPAVSQITTGGNGTGMYQILIPGVDMDYQAVALRATASGASSAEQIIYTS